jgi:indolepyruvate ferredoxin oxidoreductase alpha subunit
VIFKVATPYPFPESMACSFLRQVGEVLAVEELDPVVERELIYMEGKFHLDAAVHGKLDGSVAEAGEYTVESVKRAVADYIGLDCGGGGSQDELPGLPARPPVLCAGCPHRGAFYAVKLATKGMKTAFCGDIGCYTLGNSKPLDMCDSCLCMGAGVTMAQGLYHNEGDRLCFSFIGDSTFFASGIPGAVNAVYNQSRQVICVLDNSTTAMTGHQPHPGTGRTMMGGTVPKLSIEKILEAIGVSPVLTVDPLRTVAAVSAVKEAAASPGVSAVIFRSPCVAIAGKLGYKFQKPLAVDADRCVGCRKCVGELGCPAISMDAERGKPVIDRSTCTACGLCAQVCPVRAIAGGKEE